jgi:phospholipid/cholesterol/gamma-HCH transport system substrate-binding protein
LIKKLSAILDPNTQNNLQSTIANLTITSRSLQRLLDAQTGVLAKSLANMESITGNLVRSNDKINNTISNLDKTTTAIANAKIEDAIRSMKNSMAKLESTVAKLNSKDGSVGLLLNDRQLYDELLQTNRSLTTLFDDIRMNPKRYVNISLVSFGGKNKKGPLTAPVYDSSGRQTKL